MYKVLLFVIVLLGGLVPAHAQETPCLTSQAYIDQFTANLETLVGYRETIGETPQDFFEETAQLADMGFELRDMRIYHENAVQQLPYCSFELNRLMLEAISAMEDFVMVALVRSGELRPRGQAIIAAWEAIERYEDRLNQIDKYAEYLDE